jgi:hypothetical protein
MEHGSRKLSKVLLLPAFGFRQTLRSGILLLVLCIACQPYREPKTDGIWHGYVFANNLGRHHAPVLVYQFWIAEGPTVERWEELQSEQPLLISPTLVDHKFVALDVREIPHDELIEVKGTWYLSHPIFVNGILVPRAFSPPVIRVDKMWDRYDERLPLHPMN